MIAERPTSLAFSIDGFTERNYSHRRMEWQIQRRCNERLGTMRALEGRP